LSSTMSTVAMSCHRGNAAHGPSDFGDEPLSVEVGLLHHARYATIELRPLIRRNLRRGDDDEAVAAYGIDYATRQCEELLREGAPGLHFYTLNKARSTTAVVKNLALDRLAFAGADAR